MNNHTVKQELKQLAALALPIFIAQISFTAMGFVDTVMAARFSDTDLAAIGIGSSISIPIMLFAQALLFSVTAKAAPFWGAGQYKSAGQIFYQGLVLAFFAGIALGLLLYAISTQLHWFNIDRALQPIAGGYQFYLALTMPVIALYQAARSFIETTGQTRPVMFINLSGLLINIPLNAIFIYGLLGAPRLGGIGCGVATLMSFTFMLFLQCVFIYNNHHCQQALKGHSFSDAIAMRPLLSLLGLGLPIAMTMLLEVSLFTVITLLIAPFGIAAIASHQIALSLSSQIFMVPYSQATALTIHIGHLIGEARQGIISKARVIFAIKIGLATALVISLCTSSLIILFNYELSSLYTKTPELMALAAALVIISAAYQIPDAIQVCCNGVLRAFHIVKKPLAMSLVAYWLIALPIGYLLAFYGINHLEPLETKGFWVALVIGLSLNALFLSFLLWQTIRRYR